MMKLMLGLLVFLIPVVANGAGTLEDTSFYSESLGQEMNIRVYLPEGYSPTHGKKYPVVYFLHGSNYSYPVYWYYFQMKSILDSLIDSKEIEPIIFVTPDGLTGPYGGSFWTNSELYGAYEDYMAYDVVEFIDNNYRTKAKRSERCIMGLSMGGYGALMIALKHPESFQAVASHSGPIALDVLMDARRELILDEYDSGPPYEYNPAAGILSSSVFTMSGAWSPNLDNPPYLVDFPMDQWGEIRPEVMERWIPHDPMYLATLLDPDCAPEIYFDCGTEDEYIEYPSNVAFAQTLDDLRYDYTFEPFVGGHIDQFMTRFPISLMFLNDALKSAGEDSWNEGNCWENEDEQDRNDQGSEPNFWNLDQGFRALAVSHGNASIVFAQQLDAKIRIDIFDVSGRLTRCLIDQELPSGTHCITWNGKNDAGQSVSTGVYFLQLKVEDKIVDSSKLVFIH